MAVRPSDYGWTEYEASIEARNWGACFEAARKAGYTQEQAENCEDGALQCPTCPWKPREVLR